MRKRFWFIASCGIVCIGLGLAVAQDSEWFGVPASTASPTNSGASTTSSSSTTGGSADHYFPRNGATDAPSSAGSSNVSLTDPISTNPSDHTDPSRQIGPNNQRDVATEDAAQPPKPAARRQTPKRIRSIINANHERYETADSEEHPRRNSGVIHAEYRRPDGESERSKIRQVTANAGPSAFEDTPDDLEKPNAAPSRRAANSNHARPTSTRKASESLAIAPTVSESSQTPVVTAQWIKKSSISVGQECTCDLVVKNNGPAIAKDLTVEGYFPSTVRLMHAEPMPADNQDHVTWSFSALGPGEERVIHIKMIPSKRGELATLAQVRFTEMAANVFVVEEPLLKLAVQGPKEVLIGDAATQIITVSNPGTGVAHKVAIEARLTKGLENPRGERLMIQVGSLNPGESRPVRLPIVAIGGGVQTVSVHASAGSDLRQDATSRITVAAPSVKVAMDGPSLRYVGRKGTYVVTVTNDGANPANNVRITQKLPEGFRFVRADKNGEYDDSARAINWFIGHMEAKEVIRLKAELGTTLIGSYVHTVAAMSEQGARSEAKLETLVDGTASLEVEIVDQNDPVEVGVETAYEIHVRNDGSKAAENVAISCEMAPSVELVRAEGGASSRGQKGRLAFRPVSVLEPGKTAIFRVYVRGRAEGNHKFTVHLSSASMKEPLTQEEMTKFYAE